MSILYYRDFCTTDDHGYNLYRAMEECRRVGAKKLVFEPNLYEIYPDRCSERMLCISNHGHNGQKRIAVLIEDMEDFEIDFNGATLRVHGEMTHFALLRSSHVTIKNVSLQNPQTMFMQARVAAHGEDYVDLYPEFGGEQFSIVRGELIVNYPYASTRIPVGTNIEFNAETGCMEDGTSDCTLGQYWSQMQIEKLENGNLRVRGGKRKPPLNNVLIINGTRRLGAGVFCEGCSDLRLENVVVNQCLGMGLIAQLCHNITLDGFSTRREGGRFYTACADATHFVHCTGLIKVENCFFEGQLDDSLNIHGIYTRIIDRRGNELFVKEMHSEAKGIRIYQPGDRIQALDPESLLPYVEKTVKEVEYINRDTTRLVLEETAEDIKIGDDVENLSRSPELIFRNNTVRDNRARGMLIASPGKTLIENCHFHTGGCSIKFESDGAYWFESGATKDVTIRGCHFDKCKHADKWGDEVICFAPRRKVVEGEYFHGTVRVIDNVFDMLIDGTVNFNNVTEAIFEGNKITPCGDAPAVVRLQHVGNARVQDDVRIEEEA